MLTLSAFSATVYDLSPLMIEVTEFIDFDDALQAENETPEE